MILNILLTFIPIFVAVDAVGTLPIFISLTAEITAEERKRIISQSVLTAGALATGFLFLGKGIFNLLGITVGDFMVAGGVILFIIAVGDIINPANKRFLTDGELGPVPIGTPLIVGPAVLTTSLLLLDTHGLFPTLVSIAVNIILAGVIFSLSGIIIKILGNSGTRAVSKIMSLLLSAIAVMMIRKGILFLISAGHSV